MREDFIYRKMNRGISDSRNIFDICRLCLWKSIKFHDVFAIECDSLTLARKIEESVGVAIARDDGLSKLVCPFCALKVELFYEFKRICKESNEFLKEYVEMFYTNEDTDSEQEQLSEEEITIKEEPIFQDTLTFSDEVLPAMPDNLQSEKSTSATQNQEQLEENDLTFSSIQGSVLNAGEGMFVPSEEKDAVTGTKYNSLCTTSQPVAENGSEEQHVVNPIDKAENTSILMENQIQTVQPLGFQPGNDIKAASTDKQELQNAAELKTTDIGIKVMSIPMKENTESGKNSNSGMQGETGRAAVTVSEVVLNEGATVLKELDTPSENISKVNETIRNEVVPNVVSLTHCNLSSQDNSNSIVKTTIADAKSAGVSNIGDKAEQTPISVSAFVEETDTETMELNVAPVKKLEMAPEKQQAANINDTFTSHAGTSTLKKQKMSRSKRRSRNRAAIPYTRVISRKNFTSLYNCRYCFKEFRYKASCSNHESYCYQGLGSFKDSNWCGYSGSKIRRFSHVLDQADKPCSISDTINSENSNCHSEITSQEQKKVKKNVTELLTKEAGIQEQDSGDVVNSLNISDPVNSVECEQMLLPVGVEGAHNRKMEPENPVFKNNKTKEVVNLSPIVFKCALCSKPFKDELTLMTHTEVCGVRNKVNSSVPLNCSNCHRNFRYMASLKYHEAFCNSHVKRRRASLLSRLKKCSNRIKKGVNSTNTESNPTVSVHFEECGGPVKSHEWPSKEDINITKHAHTVYKCQYCLKVFKHRSNHYKHQKMCSTVSTGKLTSDNGSSRGTVKARNFWKILKCRYCDQKFRLRRRFTAHERKCQFVTKISMDNSAVTDKVSSKNVIAECTGIGSSQENLEHALPKAVKYEIKKISVLSPEVCRELSFNTATATSNQELAFFPQEYNRLKTKFVRDVAVQSDLPENFSQYLHDTEYCQSLNGYFSNTSYANVYKDSSMFVQNCSLEKHNLLFFKNKFHCCFCDCSFTCKERLTRHVKLCGTNTKFTCRKCKQKFSSKIMFKLHKINVCVHDQVKSDHPYALGCNQSVDEDELMKNAIVNLVPLPACKNCSCIFSDEVALTSHVLICSTTRLQPKHMSKTDSS